MTSLHEHGARKFPDAALLASSEGRGWSGVAAEVRYHPAAELPPIMPAQVEITMTLSGNGDGVVRRSGNGRRQETAVRPGVIWLCPSSVYEDAISISRPIESAAHIYLSDTLFAQISKESRSSAIRSDSIDYLAGLDDPIAAALIAAIVAEAKEETASGRLLVEALSLRLAARLATAYGTSGARLTRMTGGIDQARLRRVLDYIDANVEEDLSIEALARVACLSAFHFARAFKVAFGVPPHRYVAERRFRHATQLLQTTHLSLAEISDACRFSSQANFTRAFVRTTGITPGSFRRRRLDS